MMAVAYVGLGANLGKPAENIGRALEMLAAAGVRIAAVSSLRRTRPVGGPPQPDFINGVAELHTTLGPFELLSLLMDVERGLGRVRGAKWGPRTVDLDLLLYDDAVVSSAALVLPHPLMCERKFVLEPLAEIAPRTRHPVSGATAAELRDRLARGRAPDGTLRKKTDRRRTTRDQDH
jgi:2-amino-4-hydroxy-6-hydroxymethyldihydropteridine diphosphokinase